MLGGSWGFMWHFLSVAFVRLRFIMCLTKARLKPPRTGSERRNASGFFPLEIETQTAVQITCILWQAFSKARLAGSFRLDFYRCCCVFLWYSASFFLRVFLFATTGYTRKLFMRLKRRAMLFALLAAAGLPLIFAGLSGCGGGGSSNSPAPSADRPVTTRSAYGPLEFTLTAPKPSTSEARRLCLCSPLRTPVPMRCSFR